MNKSDESSKESDKSKESDESSKESKINIHLVPYKNNKSSITKYHILNLDDTLIKYNISNVYSFFGREIDNKFLKNQTQHRLNICFSKIDIDSKNSNYLELTKIILDMENYFRLFDDFADYELVSNIIDRKEYGIVIRFHLKTLKDKTITPLKQITSSKNEFVEWIDFDKTKKFNFSFHPDCLWIDEKNKKYGISNVIDKVVQFIEQD